MKQLSYLFSMLIVASLTGIALASCGSDDEGKGDSDNGGELSISDGWTDNGATCYYKWTTAAGISTWLKYEFDGQSDESLCTKATQYYAYTTDFGASDFYKGLQATGSSVYGNITNIKKDGKTVSYELSDLVGKTKAYFKKAYGIIPDEPDTPTELNVTENCLDGTWEEYKTNYVGKQNKEVVENYSYSSDPNTAEGTYRYVFNLSAKTCTEQISRNYGYVWDNINSYTFEFTVISDQSYGSIRFTDAVTGEKYDWKKITKLNSTELVIVWEYTMPPYDGNPATDVTLTKYYKRIE